MLTATHIETALKAAGAGSGLVMSTSDIATAFNDAILKYGQGLFKTTNSVAALVSESMMESAYFRTTEEYNKTEGDYQPYRGRTFIQITWMSNYAAFGAWCVAQKLVTDPNVFVNTPALLSDKKWAAIGAVWYFTQVKFYDKPLVAYTDDIGQVGKAVNLGDPYSKYVPNGHAARAAAYAAVRALGSSIVPVIPPKEPVVMYSSKYGASYVNWRGGNFAPLTVTKLAAIPSTVRVTQGGLSFAPASAMTHAGIGVFDLNTDGMTKDEVWDMCRELWEVNIIPCPRGFSSDSFQGRTISNTNDGNEHLHCLDVDMLSAMHPEGKDQVDEILNRGGDGLYGNRAYVGPSKKYRTAWKDSAYNPANRRPVQDDGVYFTNTDNALGLNFEREVTRTREKNYKVVGVAEVKRWGRWNVLTEGGLFYAKSILSSAPVK